MASYEAQSLPPVPLRAAMTAGFLKKHSLPDPAGWGLRAVASAVIDHAGPTDFAGIKA